MKYIIDKKSNNLSIKSYLILKLNLSSRLKKHLKKYYDGILLNGIHADVTAILKENDVLELDFSDRKDDVNEYLVKSDIPLSIVYEDENYTVINKPAMMPTHQSLNHYDDTLANALAYRYGDRPYVFRAVNRLDKDTSGIVLTANNKLYAEILSKKLIENKVTKEYIAIVEGKLTGEGVVEEPIARQGDSIIKREVREDGEYALTKYKVVYSDDEISVIKVYPITGRTHQIRVHMSYIGHSLLGDTMYGSNSSLISRHALHAYKLDIDGIGSFTAPLPEDMIKIIRSRFNETDL
jgi:23S rRNA pseudouridine1911/1915/1917 synthase